MRTPSSEKVRLFLVNRIFSSIYGLTFPEWVRLLRKQQFAVDPPYWPRAAFITFASVCNSLVGLYEEKKYEPQYRNTEIQPPIFILGYWRSGTTFLHNLLSLDSQFAYPNVWQVLNPHTFLTTERLTKVVRFVAPQNRMMDKMGLSGELPFEDEFAAAGTLRTPFLSWAFHRSADEFDRYLTFHDVSEAEIAEWEQALLTFYKKLTWKYKRPLVLKSPPHTGKVRVLLDMFPDARFIHIHRNPYEVFQSTQRLIEVSFRTTGLQRVSMSKQDLEDWILQRYQKVYDAFFEECKLIPTNNFYEISYENLERDPITEMRQFYEQMKIPHFAQVQPQLEAYVESLRGYRKNTHTELPLPLRETIAHAWRRSFETWGYTI